MGAHPPVNGGVFRNYNSKHRPKESEALVMPFCDDASSSLRV